jgi:hypothetical protein
MGAGTRILAGCGCATLGAAVVVAAGLGLGAWWLKGKATDVAGSIEALTSTTKEIDEWERRANAHPYQRPPDGVIPEARLLAFLDVRRAVHAVYQTYEVDLEGLRRGAEAGDVSAAAAELVRLGGKTVRMFNELRLAQVKALTQAGMSEEEYYAIQTAVYMAAGAWQTSQATGALPAEAMTETARRVREAMKAGIETARERGVPGSERLSDADVERLEEALAEMETTGAEALTVPPANVELFRRHEDAIRKYAMHGLAFLGL